jgi:predicted chitinase
MPTTTPPILLPLFSLTNKTPEQLFAIAESGPAGFYPVGVNRFWHGGIHLHGSEPVRALWDGEVVAYRVSHEHLTGTIDDKEETFSNSFVLLRHTYETPKGAQIKFYSLYMHLLPLGEYSNAQAQFIKAPSIFHQKSYTVKCVTDYALALCDLSNSHTVLGYIPNGSAFEAVSDPAMHGEWHRVSFNGLDGCVNFKTNHRVHQTHPNTNSYTVTLTHANATAPEQGINLRDAATGGKIIGFAPNGTELRFKDPASHGDNFLKTPAYRELEAGGVFVHAATDSLIASNVVAPIQYDNVINLNPPLKVKAGELLGYAGPYCNREAVAHVEIFTDTINFLDNPKQETWGKKDGELNAYTWPGFKRFEENALSVNGYVDKAKFQLFNYGEDGVVDNSALLNEVDTNKDGNISINEIRNSVNQLRYHVCRHPTEWSAAGLDTKFARLKDKPWKLKENHYQQHLDHIRKLTFWEQVTQKPVSSTVWHLHPVAFVKNLKSMMGITKDQLRAIMPGITDENLEKYILPLNKAMEKYGINENRLRQCHFLGQVGHETADLSFMMEYSSKTPNHPSRLPETNGPYNNSQDTYFDQYNDKLGNVDLVDGQKFRGRGALHITGRCNYADYWVYRGWLVSGDDFKASWWAHHNERPAIISDPQKISFNPDDACDVGGWFWRYGNPVHKNMNLIADADTPDVTQATAADAISKIINSGENQEKRDIRKHRVIKAKQTLMG